MVPLSEGPFHLDDYVAYVQEFIQALSPDLSVMSVCQPTVPVLAAVSLLAANNDPAVPNAMIMMGGPIDARRSPTTVNDFAEKRSKIPSAEKKQTENFRQKYKTGNCGSLRNRS